MKKAVYLISMLLSLGIVYNVYAQKDNKGDKEKKEKKKEYKVPVYLGGVGMRDTSLPHYVFDSLLATKLIAQDSTGPYIVHGYLFTYGERNLYEDSVGNLMWVTDLLSEYCYGDTMTNLLLNIVTDRTKYGDTIYFDQIKTTSPNGNPVMGKPMRFVLIK